MIYLKRIKYTLLVVLITVIFSSCSHRLPEIKASVVTEQTPHDTDDPAIWVNKDKPEESIVFGTDKDEVNGGIYAFNLNGEIIKEKSLTGLSYPNNIDLTYNFKLNDSTNVDIIGFTEREKHQVRLFSVPDMKMLDKGGFKVFEDESEKAYQLPMGISFYTNKDNSKYFIVSRKEGSLDNYLYQYLLVTDSTGVKTKFVRKFGKFSGKKEIEAIAVDQELGYIYYSDEDHCIRKYYADPTKGNEEIACFGSDNFERDIEGIAIAKYPNNKGYIIVSNQQALSFSIFDRNTNEFIKEVNLGTLETDGCDVTTVNLGEKYPKGIFVSMNDNREFYYHNLEDLQLNEK